MICIEILLLTMNGTSFRSMKLQYCVMMGFRVLFHLLLVTQETAYLTIVSP